MTVLLHQDCLKPSLKQVSNPTVPFIESLGIDPVQLSHAYGKISIGGVNEEMVMLCEAPDYVKLSFFISELSFIFSLWSIFYCT
jgi:hypothetical protein